MGLTATWPRLDRRATLPFSASGRLLVTNAHPVCCAPRFRLVDGLLDAA